MIRELSLRRFVLVVALGFGLLGAIAIGCGSDGVTPKCPPPDEDVDGVCKTLPVPPPPTTSPAPPRASSSAR